MKKNVTIGIVGAGGDGVVVLGSLLQHLAALRGYFGQMPKYYGPQIRGGGSAAKLSLDIESSSLPKDILDILVCFSWEKYLEFKQELRTHRKTLVLYENDPPEGINLSPKSFKLPFTRKSQELTGESRNKNIVALGLLERMILNLATEEIQKMIEGRSELGILKKNLPALEGGRNLFSEFSLPELRLLRPKDVSPKIILHGNDAVVLAGKYAGCKMYFYYPITPASEIAERAAEELPGIGGVFLQTEDEIAAIGLAIGSSFVGAKSMAGTSGPGFDLMTENMTLASVAEIPLVIVVVQRGGSSTGIPSKSEQSDLNHAIYGGHGSAPRVVLAAHDMESCYRLTIESINIAEYYQSLVILLSDQLLGQTLVATNDDFLKKEYPLLERKKPREEDFGNYQRYQLTKDFISPMAEAGKEGFAYQTTGLAHDEEGTPAFDFETNQKMHEKRWKKLLPFTRREDLVKIFGSQKSDKGIITWGSSAQAVLAAVKDFGLEKEVKVCVPELIYPLPDKVRKFIKSTKKLLIVEMNYSGQLYHYLRSQENLPKRVRTYNRVGGKPFNRGELKDSLLEVAK